MHKYGLRGLSKPDPRDFCYTKSELSTTNVSHIDLRSGFPDLPFDQGHLGSCVENSGVKILRFLENKEGMKNMYMPSRLFIYWNIRNAYGQVLEDSGSMIKDFPAAVNKYGSCPENGNPLWSWSYSDDQVKFRAKPPLLCYLDAKKHRSIRYERVNQDLDSIKSALIEGYPIHFGFLVYESFEKIGSDGLVPMPSSGEQQLGGHAVVLCGFNNETKRFIVGNSWSERWGDKGYCYFPYEYLLDPNLSGDLWVYRFIN